MNIPVAKRTNKINKLLVVGHPMADSEFVLEVMKKCSISPASHLQKEGIEAKEISQILLKAHDVNSVDEVTEQMTINQVWNGLAMDLMMSNLEHSKWVWADSDALPLLDYWRSLDTSLAFVLVYNSPEKFVENLLQTEKSSTIDIKKAFENWLNYNRMLLNFYYRNSDRVILVNSQLAQVNSKKYLQEVGKQIELKNEEIPVALIELQEEAPSSGSDDLYMYFVQQLVNENAQAKQLYMELESVSNLPLMGEKQMKNFTISDALKSYMSEKEKYSGSVKQQETFISEIEEGKQKSQNSEKTKAIEEENKLLLEQLHLVQEELEKYYLENIELKNKTTLSSSKQKKHYYGAADRVKQQLSYRLGAKMIQKSKSFGGVLTLPFALYAEIKAFRKEKSLKKKLPPLRTYDDAYEAERVKKHLSYRLGQAMIQSMKSPVSIFKFPFALRKAYKEYQKGKINV